MPICVKSRLSKRGKYYVVAVTELAERGYIDLEKIYNIYIYTDIHRKNLVAFETRKPVKIQNNRVVFYIKPVDKLGKLLHRTPVILCIEHILHRA